MSFCYSAVVVLDRFALLLYDSCSSKLLNSLLEQLPLVDSVVVGKPVCKGEGEDKADYDNHQDKRSRHCHTQEQTFLTRKRRWNIQEKEKNGQKVPNLIKFRSKGSQIGAIREVGVQVGWDNQAKFHLDVGWWQNSSDFLL